MINIGQMIEDDAKPRLKFLAVLPCARYCSGRIVKDVTNQVKTGNLARDSGTLD
jgi:hypothetical protein